MITIRPLQAEDEAVMVSWMLAFFDELKASGDPYFDGAATSAEAIRRDLALPLPVDRLGVMALHDDQPAGYLTARLDRPFVVESPIPQVGHVSHVYVAPDLRRLGVATALLAHAEQWLGGRGIGWMQLSWQPANHAADRSWRAAGFEPYRIYGRRAVPPG